MENLTGICAGKIAAESQRETELEQYGHDDGCLGYKQLGCYECDGLDTACERFTPATPRQIESYLNRKKPKPADTRSPEEIMDEKLQKRASREKQ